MEHRIKERPDLWERGSRCSGPDNGQKSDTKSGLVLCGALQPVSSQAGRLLDAHGTNSRQHCQQLRAIHRHQIPP